MTQLYTLMRGCASVLGGCACRASAGSERAVKRTDEMQGRRLPDVALRGYWAASITPHSVVRAFAGQRSD